MPAMSLSKLELYVLDLDYGVFRDICQNLDVESKYRDVIAAADDTRFQLEPTEVELCAKASYSNGSPSEELLKRWGNNMRVCELVALLDKLRLERCLLRLRDPVPLRIIQQPVSSVEVKEGSNLELFCEADGFPYPIYSWFMSDILLSHSNSGKLVKTNVSFENAGKYVCRVHHTNHVTGKMEYLFSQWSCVRVVPGCRSLAPGGPRIPGSSQLAITRHPSSQVIRLGDSLVLRCEALGTGMLEYYWVKNGALIKGGPHYVVPSATAEDNGNYYCIVKNHEEEVHSLLAAVQVTADNEEPQILQQPVDTSSEVGGVALFTVKAQYISDLFYQWYFLSDGDHSERIKDGTTAELRVPVEGFFNAGSYQCRIYAADNHEVLSRCAKLKVTGERKRYVAADKLALIIGVSTYRSHGEPLPAVEHDMQATVAAFQKMGFKVVSLLDLTLAEMNDAINMFCDLLSQDVYAVFYCAGHGFMGNDGRHYLIPWDACHSTSPNECLCVETVEEKIQLRKPKLLMFFLDICRRKNDCLKESVRVLRTAKAVPNKIVLYAASQGQQAFEQSRKLESVPRGLFNKCLLEVIDKHLGALDLFKAIMDKFKKLPYSRDQYPQFPEMMTNNEDYDRTLQDPIDKELNRTNIAVKTSLWRLAHGLPQDRRISLTNFCTIILSFECITSNVMDMCIGTQPVSGWQVVVSLIEDNLPCAVRPSAGWRSPRNQQLNGSTYFRFSNLQRLKANLVISLSVRLIKESTGNSHHWSVSPIDLGRPLVAVVNLGQQSRELAEDVPVSSQTFSDGSLTGECSSDTDIRFPGPAEDNSCSDSDDKEDSEPRHYLLPVEQSEYPSSLQSDA